MYYESWLLRPLQEHKLDFKSVLLNRAYLKCAAAPGMWKRKTGRTGVSLLQPPVAVGAAMDMWMSIRCLTSGVALEAGAMLRDHARVQ